MKKKLLLAVGVLLSFALAAVTYAGQGQTGFGGVSGEMSADPDAKSAPLAKPAPAPSIAPKTQPRTATSSDAELKTKSKTEMNSSTQSSPNGTHKKTVRTETTETTTKSSTPAQAAAAAGSSPPLPARTATIEGEVLRIMGDSYLVRDTSGKSVRLHVDKNTKLDSNISAHDMVEVHASEMLKGKSTASDKKQYSKMVWHADAIAKR